jgi:hypothetical protein
MVIPNQRGGYSFLKGISPYSAGVVAARGFAIVQATLRRTVPWRAGFEIVDKHLRAASRPRQALCAMALRSPKPFTFAGFNAFNAEYVRVLESWDLMVNGVNPIARTNVAPEIEPPAEPSLYSFAYTVPDTHAPVSFIVAGAGELPEGSLDPHDVVRRGETSLDALRHKARFVIGLMSGRLKGLGVSWDDVTATDVYTVHDLHALAPVELLPFMGGARLHGLTWYHARPPIESIEFEMDLRGPAREVYEA